MKHAVALIISLGSMLFLMGDSCDSGDFTTSYFCCGQGAACTPNQTTCAASDCNTGYQTFLNGQNECAVLQSDGANNSCALVQRFAEYINIGCTGTFTESPAVPGALFLQPQNLTVTTGAPGSQTVTLTWTAPTGTSGYNLLYTILRGTVTGTETPLSTAVAPTFTDSNALSGIATGEVYYYVVVASITYAGNVASPGNISNEVMVTVP
jgi:hypothetical protein